jgi:hypothetical protein
MLDPRYVIIENMPNLTNNKQRGQLYTLIVRKEKRKKKHKQLIIDGNSIIICLQVPYHVEEGMTVHPVR